MCIKETNMKPYRTGIAAVTVAWLGTLLPPMALATAPATFVSDIALRPGGVLIGQVLDAQGKARAGAQVSIQQAGHEVVRTTSDANGIFAAQGLRGGEYQLLTEDASSVSRMWAADTAPPNARPGALLVSGQDIVRGQYGPMHTWLDWMKAHPYITAGVVAAAIAVPLAFIDDDDDSGS
jgi:hypothetical protein